MSSPPRWYPLVRPPALAAPQGVGAALADKAETCRRLEALKNARVLMIDAIVDPLLASNEVP